MSNELIDTAASEEAPLYRRIQNALRLQITQGTWSPGQALPSRRQLCEEFRTTRVTLDKAILGLIREGLLISAKGSGTFVAPPSSTNGKSASSEITRSQQADGLRIGVVLGRWTPGATADEAETDNFYVGPLFTGIRDGVVGRKVEITYARVAGGDYLRFYRESTLDGIVLMTPTLGDLPMLRQLEQAKVPFVAVCISPDAALDASLPCVDSDNRKGAADAVQHLLSEGHQRIALINLALSHSDHLDRMEGFLRTMAAARIAVDPRNLVLYQEYDVQAFEPRIDEWLTQAKANGHVPTAVLACDYFMTLAILRVLRRHGLRVPDDISVVGFDDPLSAEHLTPPLTTVRQPVYQVGRRAVERLLQHLQEGNSAAPLLGAEILHSELVIRESTRPIHAEIHAERTLVLS